MAYKIFLDANIVLDVLHADRVFHEDAKELFFAIEANICSAYYSESILTIMAYVLRKKMTSSEINSIIIEFNKKINFLSCTKIQSTVAAQQDAPDFEDALLYQIALHHQMDYFVTSNTKDFKKIQKENLPVIRAKELNKILAQ
jgi:predicted nucleic acid-binding protein